MQPFVIILIINLNFIGVFLSNLTFLPLIISIFDVNPGSNLRISCMVTKNLAMLLNFEHIIKRAQQLIDCEKILV